MGLAEVAEEPAVVAAVELIVGEVAGVPDAEANDVVARAAQLPDRFFQQLERELGEGLRFGRHVVRFLVLSCWFVNGSRSCHAQKT
jgi:hypothetical protein